MRWSTLAAGLAAFALAGATLARAEEQVGVPVLPLPPEITSLIGLPDSPVGSPAQVEDQADLPVLPFPPTITGLIGLPGPYAAGRLAHLEAVRQAAEQHGVPADLADAVVQVESAYNPYAVGGAGEIGLMQVSPPTAAMLGHRDGLNDLFNPATNIRLGVMYLARAWQLADGDLCRALMKYRAGHGEERMSALSVEYCRRAKGHLAAIGSPLGAGAPAAAPVAGGTFSATAAYREPVKASDVVAPPLPPRRGDVGAMPVASVALDPPLPPRRGRVGAVPVASVAAAPPLPLRRAETRRVRAASIVVVPPLPPRRGDVRAIRVASLEPLKLTPQQVAQARRARSRHIWATHEERMRTINSKVKASDLRIAAGS